MPSSLILTFNGSPEVALNEAISVNIDIDGVNNFGNLEVFKSARTRNSEVSLSDIIDENTIASNFLVAWSLDYSDIATGLINGNQVTLFLTNPSYQFLNPTGTAITNGGISFSVNNQPREVEKKVQITSYSQSIGNECSKTLVSLAISGGVAPYNLYVNNVLTSTNQTISANVLVDRGTEKSIRVVDSLGDLIGTAQTVNTRKLIENDISISLANLSTGTTVTVNTAFIQVDVSNYTYSLNNVDFQTSNVFTGQTNGNKTVYVKDGFGCVTSKNFIVDGVTTLTETVFEISNINSFRFAKVENGKKNQLNTLSFNELRINTYAYYQKYLSTDVITTQFRTNAQYIRAYKVLPDLTETDLTVLKKTNNINLQVKTTCTYFDLGNGRSGVYFGVVDKLNYVTEDFIEQLNFGSALPGWASEKGQLVTIEGIGQVPIDAKSYSDTYNSFIAEFNIAYTGSEVEKKISAEYNVQPYEIYEFDTAIVDDCFYTVIEVGTNSDNIDFQYISEPIKKVEDNEFLFDITYWDDKNVGKFNYQTGIKNKLRIFGYQDDIGEQNTEGYNGDEEYYVTDNEIYDLQRFTFNRVSTQIANKLRLVFAHKYILINGLYYKISETPEVTGDGNFNLKKFIVNLKRGGEQFLTSEQEVIVDSSEQQQIGNGIASSKEIGLLAWTKNI